MEVNNLTPLTSEQLVALGNGIVHAQDPATNRIYLLIEEIDPTIDDEYVREKLDEGLSSIEAGEVSDWNVDQFKDKLRKRHAAENPNS